MSRSCYEQDDKKYEKWAKEGRGQGRLGTYKPWLTVFDVASYGRSHRIPSFKLSRIVHTFSDIEAARVYQLEHDSSVIDFNEQFPLDREKTLEIANRPSVSFKHPSVRGFHTVMTTDFVVHYKDRIVAEQIKPFSELIKPRVIEKLTIEKAYWNDKNIEFLVKTEKDFPLALKKNLQWLHQPLWYKTPPHKLMGFAAEFMALFTKYPNDGIAEIAEYLEMTTTLEKLQEGHGLMLLRQLFAKHYLMFDLNIYFSEIKGKDISFNEIKMDLRTAG
ncbi:TnsA endonuclease N-terminal domain-containing protein [Shewanella olleyana]|uniref:TnsA endonuclease N-terminal domain-containing protein n=1 Tax=Shewanella olleyana TaxID=135626 RepID=UPI00200EB4B1|nr:TnsA endonuclease N-terminal domain-containing protein [Shewanella olleyana]MCL1068004.1 TnsA endonuclease N-terminal domain-containing protein [Shewanella olleyana]